MFSYWPKKFSSLSLVKILQPLFSLAEKSNPAHLSLVKKTQTFLSLVKILQPLFSLAEKISRRAGVPRQEAGRLRGHPGGEEEAQGGRRHGQHRRLAPRGGGGRVPRQGGGDQHVDRHVGRKEEHWGRVR